MKINNLHTIYNPTSKTYDLTINFNQTKSNEKELDKLLRQEEQNKTALIIKFKED